MRTDIPDLRFSRDAEIGAADGSILSYLRAEPAMTLVAALPDSLSDEASLGSKRVSMKLAPAWPG